MQSALEILMSRKAGKISAQPHTTLSIQFLERENNDKTVHRRWKNRFVYSSMGLCGNFIQKPNKCRKLISASNAPTLWETLRKPGRFHGDKLPTYWEDRNVAM